MLNNPLHRVNTSVWVFGRRSGRFTALCLFFFFSFLLQLLKLLFGGLEFSTQLAVLLGELNNVGVLDYIL